MTILHTKVYLSKFRVVTQILKGVSDIFVRVDREKNFKIITHVRLTPRYF